MNMDYPLSFVQERLIKYKECNKPHCTWEVLRSAIGLSQPTLDAFIKNKNQPRQGTIDAIVSFLVKKEYLKENTPEDDILKRIITTKSDPTERCAIALEKIVLELQDLNRTQRAISNGYSRD